MHNSYDVIGIDNCVILNKLQNFHFVKYSILVYQFGLKHAEPDICQIFKTDIILIIKYIYLNWNIVKQIVFYQKKND